MSAYLDASVLLPMLIDEPASARVDAFIHAEPSALWVSDFAAAEIASAFSRLVRTRMIDSHAAETGLLDFAAWTASDTVLITLDASDVRVAAALVRRFDLMVRTPDALHIATCRRLNGVLITLDQRLAAAAESVGVASRLL